MTDEKPKGYLAQYGARVLANGYEIVPIRRGSKAPPMDGWQKIRATPALLRSWVEGDYARSGLGILTRKTIGVDLDIPDTKVALHMQAFVEKNFGRAPVRIGKDPKRLLLYRAAAPFSKINSNAYIDDWDTETDDKGRPIVRKVEILGDGQQFVAFHVHPDTGKAYEWITKSTPSNTPVADLPELSEEGGQAIVAEFERIAEEREWSLKKSPSKALARQQTGRVATDDVFADYKPKVDIPEAELHAKLLLVPGSEDYDTWLEVGMALWHQFDGEDRGLELWHEWSATAPNYDGDALDSKWETFDVADKGREPVTARLILKYAKDAATEIAVETFREIKEQLDTVDSVEGLRTLCAKIKGIEFDMFARSQIVDAVKKVFFRLTKANLPIGTARDMVRYERPETKEAPRWLEGWVYVTADEGFFSRTKRYGMSTAAFNAAFSRHMLTKTDVLEGKANPETLPAAFALNTVQVPVVVNRMYLPGEDDLFHFNSKPHVNSYNPINVPEPPAKLNAAEKAAIATAKAHFAHLFTDERDRGVLLDAIAYVVQNPGRRLNWAILMQGCEGDGKSWFSGLLGAVLGPENVTNLTATALEEKNNAWAEGSQVNFFEEVKLHGHNRFDVMNKVKPLITNTLVSVRRMQVDWYEVLNTATYFFTTNFKDALPIDENDSRYFIMLGRFQTREALLEFMEKEPDYYDRLFGCLEHTGALRKWLLGHRVSPDFSNVKRAPQSKGKMEMIRYSRSEEAVALDDILRNSAHLDIGPVLLNVSRLSEELNERGIDVPFGRGMSKLLLDAGFTKLDRIRVNGDLCWLWSRTPERFTDPESGHVDSLKIKNWLKTDL
jgi:hypothetical protein